MAYGISSTATFEGNGNNTGSAAKRTQTEFAKMGYAGMPKLGKGMKTGMRIGAHKPKMRGFNRSK